MIELSLCKPGMMSTCEGAGKSKEHKELRKKCKFYEKISDNNTECLWLWCSEYCWSPEAQKHWQKRR